MYYILGILLILGAGGLMIFRSKNNSSTLQTVLPDEEPKVIASDCCGAHEICDFDESLFDQQEIVYFNDIIWEIGGSH